MNNIANKKWSPENLCQNHGGLNKSPQISWATVEEADYYSLVLVDIDAVNPSGVYLHWVLTDIPKALNELPEMNSQNKAVIKVGDMDIRQSSNSTGEYGYLGPCPPDDKEHRYYFLIFSIKNGEPANIYQNLKNFIKTQNNSGNKSGLDKVKQKIEEIYTSKGKTIIKIHQFAMPYRKEKS